MSITTLKSAKYNLLCLGGDENHHLFSCLVYNITMFKQKFTVTSTDIDGNLEIKLSCLTRYMQQVATDHANKIKFGHIELNKKGLMWVIIRMQMKINRLPKVDEEFIISTHPGKDSGFLFLRHFEIFDTHNNLLAVASSSWVVLNHETRKIVLKPFDKKIPEESYKDDLPEPAKVVGEANELVDTRIARYSEVDMNGHINNTRYVDYIQDSHSTLFFKENRISSILINFDKEIKEGDEIKIYSNKANPEIIHGKANDSNSFSAKIEYIKI